MGRKRKGTVRFIKLSFLAPEKARDEIVLWMRIFQEVGM